MNELVHVTGAQLAAQRRARETARRLLPSDGRSAALGRLTDLAARLLSTPSAPISVQVSLLTDVQTIPAASGVPDGTVGSASRLEDSFCTVTSIVGLRWSMLGLQVNTTATAVVARLEQNADERDRGITRLRWSNAGHPPRMAIKPAGSVFALASMDADLLLGIDPTTPRSESVIVLDPGATVLLYTDGLVERRGQDLDEGLAVLRRALVELAHLPLEELSDRLLERMLPGDSNDDDVAIVAVRLHRQDEPRPAEAGPEQISPEVPAE